MSAHARRVLRVLCLLCLAAAIPLLVVPLPAAVGDAGDPQDLVPDKFKDTVPRLTGGVQIVVATSLGLTQINGKALAVGHRVKKRFRDVGIGPNGTTDANEGAIAANPRRKRIVVAANVLFPVEILDIGDRHRCAAYVSTDEGKTFSPAILLPTLEPTTSCHEPMLAYSPDGNRLYAVYLDVKPFFLGGTDVVLSYSDDDGMHWIGPLVVLDGPNLIPGMPFSFYDRPAIAAARDLGHSNMVYVTATKFTIEVGPGRCEIAFSRSQTMGVDWSAEAILDSSTGCGGGASPMLQGSRPAAGPDGDVFVAWYSSGTDGWLEGSFEIRARYSASQGITWTPDLAGAPAVAVTDVYETPEFLGPGGCYQQWWPAMFPDVKIDQDGHAHLVYTHDPVANIVTISFGQRRVVSTTAEDGDIRYATSGGPPYGGGSWSTPVTINDDGLQRAQGFAALALEEEGQKNTVHAVWLDHRLSPPVTVESCPQSSNLMYDIFYARKTHTEKPGDKPGWSKNYPVSDVSSIAGSIVTIAAPALASVAHGPNLFAIWTDRRNDTSIFDTDNDTFVSRISKKGGAPGRR